MNIFKEAEIVIEGLLQCIPDVPEKNCSCHLNPPCNDCVDYRFERGIIRDAKELLKKLEAAQLLLPK